MSMSPICGAESTVVHVAAARPIVGALLCAALGAGGVYQMTGPTDSFGGCGETGGEMFLVIEVLSEQPDYVCAVPEEPPVAISKD